MRCSRGLCCSRWVTSRLSLRTALRRSNSGTPFDRVLMEVHMPSLDGLEATRQILALEAEAGAARTPILALTANAFAEDRDACYAAGMDGFLVKPLDRDSLAAALSSGAAALAA